jgi:hypothetical protein
MRSLPFAATVDAASEYASNADGGTWDDVPDRRRLWRRRLRLDVRATTAVPLIDDARGIIVGGCADRPVDASHPPESPRRDQWLGTTGARALSLVSPLSFD